MYVRSLQIICALWAIARSVLFRGLVAYVDRTGWVGIVEVIACWDVRSSV